MEPDQDKLKPFVNCHTHIFKGDHVPPLLAKAFVRAPFYWLINLGWFVWLFRMWYKWPDRWPHTTPWKRASRALYSLKVFVQRHLILNTLQAIIGAWLTIQVLYFIYHYSIAHSIKVPDYKHKLGDGIKWLEGKDLVYHTAGYSMQVTLFIVLMLFFKSGRNLVWFVMKQLVSALKMLPGKQTKELLSRYVLLARYAFYEKQANIYKQLRDQYPEATEFIVLPMDMEYMDAGKLKEGFRYFEQMEELAELKRSPTYGSSLHPFIFVDPRRIKPEKPGGDRRAEGKAFFDWEAVNGKVVLKDCLIKKWIEQDHFHGLKIYPALGYYPFDEALLPLWKYANDNGIPIITHCIRGTIFYRGSKKAAWDSHPIIQEGLDANKRILLSERKNVDFCNNFTHPLNYLCLLEPKLLAQVVGIAKDDRIKELFGWSIEHVTDSAGLQSTKQTIKSDLKDLKMCFGHYGGDDEWTRFMESDRDNFAKTLVQEPNHGLRFLYNKEGKSIPGKLEQLWRSGDWYTIVSSLMLQYENVYADISYIVHNEEIYPLLKQTLRHRGLREKVLFGTDFYVVRNHKTEKCMLADALSGLDEEEITMIARANPWRFLSSSIYSPGVFVYDSKGDTVISKKD